jgi:L-fucose mutarotase
MLLGPLTHPTLIGALAAAGHGSRVLIADGNYPHSTGCHERAVRIHLNLRPGLPTVDDVLGVLVQTIPIEAAAVMVPGTGDGVEAHAGFRLALPDSVSWAELGRFEFYDECKSDDVAVVIATGEERIYANLLLTIGVRDAPTRS